MKKTLFAVPQNCTGCSRCTYICSAVKEGVFAPSKARVFINNYPNRGYSVPSICFQCPDAGCMESCPVDAIYRDDNDVVLVDSEKCTGCGACLDGCPYGVIELNTENVAYKCDLCGGDPSCVKECFADALVFQESTEGLMQVKSLQMKQLSTSGTNAEKRAALGDAILKNDRG